MIRTTRMLSSQEIISILIRNNFVFVSQRGIHKKYKKDERIVIVPDPRKEIPIGTLFSIIRQSGLDKKEFGFD